MDKCEILTEPQQCKFCGRGFPASQMIYLSTEKQYACRACYNKEFFEKPYEKQKKQWKRIPTKREEVLRDILLRHLWDMKKMYSEDIDFLCRNQIEDETRYFEKRLIKTEDAIRRATTIKEWPIKKMDTIEEWKEFLGQPFKE